PLLPYTTLFRSRVSRTCPYALRVEHQDVRFAPGLEGSAIVDAEDAGGERGHLPDGLGEGQRALPDHVILDDLRECAVAPRMKAGRTAVGTDTAVRPLQQA